MKMEIKYLDATLDEATALIDAEKNAGIVEAVRAILNGLEEAYESRDATVRRISEIVGEG